MAQPQAHGGFPAFGNQGQMGQPMHGQAPGGPQGWANPIQQPLQPPGGYPPPPQAHSAPQGPGNNQQQATVLVCPPELMGTRCPVPGLEYFNRLDVLAVKQQVDLLEVVTNVEGKNRYKIMNAFGQILMYAMEESECFERQCCKGRQGFNMDFRDLRNVALIRVERPFKCCSGVPQFADQDSCAQEFNVQAPPGFRIGSVRQAYVSCGDCCNTADAFSLLDEGGRPLAIGMIPGCHCGHPSVQVMQPNSNVQVGVISKEWAGFAKEFFTDADNFAVQFPIAMSPKVKILMLAAVFYIDYLHFEQGGNR